MSETTRKGWVAVNGHGNAREITFASDKQTAMSNAEFIWQAYCPGESLPEDWSVVKATMTLRLEDE